MGLYVANTNALIGENTALYNNRYISIVCTIVMYPLFENI